MNSLKDNNIQDYYTNLLLRTMIGSFHSLSLIVALLHGGTTWPVACDSEVRASAFLVLSSPDIILQSFKRRVEVFKCITTF